MKPDPEASSGFAQTKITRRRLLTNGARLAAAAFASSFLPPNVRRALAQDATRRVRCATSSMSSC